MNIINVEYCRMKMEVKFCLLNKEFIDRKRKSREIAKVIMSIYEVNLFRWKE